MIERLSISLLLGLVVVTSCGDGDSFNALGGGGNPSRGGAAGISGGGKLEAVSGAASGGTSPESGGGSSNTGASEPRGGVGAEGGVERGGSVGAGAGGASGAGASNTAGANTAGANTGGASNTCAMDIAGLRVIAAWDDFGYPGYALDQCRLVYVADDGALRLRDLDTGAELDLEPATNRPRRPVLDGDALAWEASLDGQPQIRVWTAKGALTLRGAFHHAAEPAASDGAIAFTAFSAAGLTADSDVLVYDVRAGTLSEAFVGPGQQRFAAISKTDIAASDFSEDPRGYFDEMGSLSDIIVRPRAGGSVISRPREGKQAFPMLSEDGTLAYLEWGAVHPEPKFSAFTLYVTRPGAPVSEDVKIRAIETEPSYIRPSLRNGILDFVDRSSGKPLLYRQPLGDLGPLSSIDFGAGFVPLGPVARQTFTLIATRGTDGTRLSVVER